METETVVEGNGDGWRGGRTRREAKDTVRERVVGNIGRAMQTVVMYKVHLRASATSAQGGQDDGKKQLGSTVDGDTWRGEIQCDPSSARRGSCTRRTAHIFLRAHAKHPAPGPLLRCFLTLLPTVLRTTWLLQSFWLCSKQTGLAGTDNWPAASITQAVRCKPNTVVILVRHTGRRVENGFSLCRAT